MLNACLGNLHKELLHKPFLFNSG